MLQDTEILEGRAVEAADGSFGKVETVYFDEEKWVIRYIVAKRGFWIFSQRVLVSPISVTGTPTDDGRLGVSLTRDEIKNAPSADLHRPISRRKEEQFYRYHRMPVYWGGAGLWGTAMTPMEAGTVTYSPGSNVDPEDTADEEEYHLRSTHEVEGYTVSATDGPVGRVSSFLFEDSTWAIRYLRIDAESEIGGGNLYISPYWVSNISWIEAQIHLGIPKSRLTEVPTVGTRGALSREEEERLHAYFEQPRYWK